jgi:AraC-like DNA-binding protein
MLLYLSLLGFLLAGILLIFNGLKHHSSNYLAVFFLLASLYKLNEYVILYSGSVWLNVIISTNIIFLHYLIGPYFYFYIRSAIYQVNQLSKFDYLHFIPAAVVLVALVPYYLTPYAHKVEIARNIVNNPAFLLTFKPTILSKWLSVLGIYLSRPVSILAYIFYSLWIFLKFRISKRQEIFSEHDKMMKKWLIVFFSIVLITFLSHWVILYFAFTKNISVMFSEGSPLLNLCSISFTLMIVSLLLFPKILYGIMSTETEHIRNIERQLSPDKETPEKKTGSVDKEYLSQIGILANELLAKQETFLKSTYNLIQLADDLNIPAHHLSYYFREVKQQNFTDFKNELRIRYACELILNEEYNEFTLEAIGEKAGFSSRGTFIRAFKKVTN